MIARFELMIESVNDRSVFAIINPVSVSWIIFSSKGVDLVFSILLVPFWMKRKFGFVYTLGLPKCDKMTKKKSKSTFLVNKLSSLINLLNRSSTIYRTKDGGA